MGMSAAFWGGSARPMVVPAAQAPAGALLIYRTTNCLLFCIYFLYDIV